MQLKNLNKIRKKSSKNQFPVSMNNFENMETYHINLFRMAMWHDNSCVVKIKEEFRLDLNNCIGHVNN